MKSHFFIVSFPRKWWPSRHPTLSLKRLNGPGVWSPSAAPWSTCHPWNGRRPSKSCGKPGRKARIILYHYMIDDICIQPMYTTGKCRFGLLIPFHIIHIYILYICWVSCLHLMLVLKLYDILLYTSYNDWYLLTVFRLYRCRTLPKLRQAYGESSTCDGANVDWIWGCANTG